MIGPGSIEQKASDNSSVLDKASEHEYVTLLNPFSEDFAAQVAQTRPVDLPFEIKDKTNTSIQTPGDLRREYGLELKNPDFQSRKHITNTVVIKAGKTINLPGNEAQVVLRQLVNELIQREGKSNKLADPEERHAAEVRIIRARGSMQELMDNRLKPVQEQYNEAIVASNQEEFPDVNREETSATPAESKDSRADSSAQAKRTASAKQKA